MRFLKLIIENYKSFQFRTEIDFTSGQVEPGRNVFLIGALNGVGKTSVLEAINICLYRGKRNEIFKAINRHQKAKGNFSCTFELHIETDEHEILVVRRRWLLPPAVKNPDPKDLCDELTVTINGEPYSNQQVSQEYLHTNFPPGITQFFFFDGEKIQELADDAALGVKGDMEAALGIAPVRRLIKDLEHIRREESQLYMDVSEAEVQDKEKELSRLHQTRKQLEDEYKQRQEDIKNFNEEVEDLQTLIESKYGFDPEKHEEIERLKRQRSELSSRLSEVERQSREWAESWLPLAFLSEYFPALRQQIDAERQVRKQTAIQEQAESLADVVAKEVQVFEVEERQQPLSEEEFQVIKERIFRVVREFVPDEGEVKSIQELLQLSDTDAAKIEWRVENLEQKNRHEFEKTLTDRQLLRQQLDPLARELEGTVGEEKAGNHLKQLLNDYHNNLLKMGRKRENLNQIAENLEGVDNKIAECEQEIKSLRQKCNEFQEQHKLLKQINGLISLFNEYIDRLRKNKIGQLRENTLLMYREIYRKGELISDIEIDPVNYIITIRDSSGCEVQKQNLSAGEKEIFAISLLWGLAETSKLSLPIVIDTPLSRLDSIHRKSIVNHYYPNAGQQVILLSTDTEVDQTYYQELEPHLHHAVHLDFDKEQEQTILKDGYFNW
jgi:DNA sulfur modification protein DndD